MSEQIFNTDDRKLKWIQCKKLSVVWAASQRPLRKAWADEIGRELDPDALGIIAVSLPNGNGIYHVVDGNHRVTGVAEHHGEDQSVPCIVLKAHDPQRCAEIWLRMNKNKKAHPVDHFNIRVTAKDVAAVEIYKIVQSHGLDVAHRAYRDDGNQIHISAVDALGWVYSHYKGDILSQTLALIRNVWPDEPLAYSAATLKSVAKFCGEHRSYYNYEHLKAKMRRWKGWSLFYKEAKTRAMDDNVSGWEGGYRAIVMAYNRGLPMSKRRPI